MLYITGQDETLLALKEKEGFEGTLQDYSQKLNVRNPHLGLKLVNATDKLPSYMPLFPVKDTDPDSSCQENASDIAKFDPVERQTLKTLQEKGIELPIVMASESLVQDYSKRVSQFRQLLNEPIVTTPWKFWNDSMTNDTIPDLISEGAFCKAAATKQSTLFMGLESLERDMLKMDALQTQIEPLRGKLSSKARSVKVSLDQQIKLLAPQIKDQVYAKVENKLTKHLRKRYAPDELKKMTRRSYGDKMARHGKLKTTQLDLVNRTDLGSMRRMLPRFNTVGNLTGRFSICLAWASVGYDTLDATMQQDFEKAVRTATAGSAGLWVGATVTTYVIGAAGTTFLVSTPFGWAVIIVAGVAAGSVAGELTRDVVESAFDGVKYVAENPFVSQAGNFLRFSFEQIGRGMMDD